MASGQQSHSDQRTIFGNDSNVTEVTTPLDLRKLLDEASVSHLTLLYSAWCPHCHAFAPVWSRVGAKLNCRQNANRLQISAFECMGQHPSRSIAADQWKAYTGSAFPEQSDDGIISPNEICARLVDGSYPSILLSIDQNHEVKQPFEHFIPEDGVVSKSIKTYHLPIDSHLTSTATILRILRESDLAAECDVESNEGGGRLEALKWLDEQGKKGGETPSGDYYTRWDKLAADTTPDDRLHDAVIGIYHVLGDWIFTEQPHLTAEEIIALKNLLLALGTSIPDPESKVRLFQLLKLVNDRSSDLAASEWKTNVEELQLMNIQSKRLDESPQSASKTCRTSSCLVWLMFHTFAQLRLGALNMLAESHIAGPEFVSLYDQSTAPELPSAQDVKSLTRLHIGADEFATVLDQLISTFFNCETCQKHFHKAFKECAADRCTWTKNGGKPVLAMNIISASQDKYNLIESHGLVLWLWRFHNIVTVRTAADKSLSNLLMSFEEDQQAKNASRTFMFANEDVRFPGSETCDICHASDQEPLRLTASYLHKYLESDMNETKMEFDRIEDFDLPMIAEYIRHFYTKPEWLPNLKSLAWNESDSSFKALKQDRFLRAPSFFFKPQRIASPNFLPKAVNI